MLVILERQAAEEKATEAERQRERAELLCISSEYYAWLREEKAAKF